MEVLGVGGGQGHGPHPPEQSKRWKRQEQRSSGKGARAGDFVSDAQCVSLKTQSRTSTHAHSTHVHKTHTHTHREKTTCSTWSAWMAWMALFHDNERDEAPQRPS
mmetsp:Transcript_4320/g.10663  ORF Transcript_4320/g.10663 Transcript_4320/m.10663 type:complete len:105 (+) Transcript_4320:959-1273(+)